MSALDFTLPPIKPGYVPKVAQGFFESAGSLESVAAGKTIFGENQKSNSLFLQRDKMFFLLEGEVDLTVHGTNVGVVDKGEIFGEMALITNMPRTATATARTDCRLIALDNKQLQQALQVAPEFALMLMSIMIIRLRETIAHLNAHGALSNNDDLKDSAVFDKKMLDKLEQELDNSSHIRYPAGKVIIQEGQAGIFMYIVLEGSVTIAIQNHIVGKIGQGGMFGEMALIERTSGRMASATSKTDCVLLAINRNVFLDLVRANPRFVMSLLSAVGNRARFMASRLA